MCTALPGKRSRDGGGAVFVTFPEATLSVGCLTLPRSRASGDSRERGTGHPRTFISLSRRSLTMDAATRAALDADLDAAGARQKRINDLIAEQQARLNAMDRLLICQVAPGSSLVSLFWVPFTLILHNILIFF